NSHAEQPPPCWTCCGTSTWRRCPPPAVFQSSKYSTTRFARRLLPPLPKWVFVAHIFFLRACSRSGVKRRRRLLAIAFPLETKRRRGVGSRWQVTPRLPRQRSIEPCRTTNEHS